jgi:uncharacterized membrane protein
MTSAHVLLLALLIGVVTGLRSLTGPAIVAWAAHRHWINLHDSAVSFMGSTVAVAIFTLLALGELVADKLPSIPSRTTVAGLIPRIVLGGLCGAAVTVAGLQSSALGGVLGAVGGIIGAFGGYQLRARLVATRKVPDFVVACLEDVVAIAGGLLIVWKL